MFSTKYFRFLFIAAAAVAASCTDDPVDPGESTDPDETPEPASLTLNFSIADLGVDVSTRAEAGGLLIPGDAFPEDGTEMLAPGYDWPELGSWTPPPTDGSELTEAEKKQNTKNYRLTEAALIEGSAMTCLTVILINYKENRIVAVRRIPDPDCPNHDVTYQNDGGLQLYPPPPGAEREKAKKNCILVKKADGTFDLAPVLRNENGTIKKDDKNHILGLVGTHACVTLDYEEPIHKVTEAMVGTDETKQHLIGQSAEKLTRGEYTLLVIANYDHRVTTASLNGVQDGNYDTYNVDTELENLANMFHQPKCMAEGIPDFKENYQYLYNLRFLMNRTLKPGSGTDSKDQVVDVGPFKDENGKDVLPYIRPAVHQTLTAAKDIYLSAGNNVINVELQRISSRTRVEVKNYAGIPLKVHSLEFSPNYTQSSCYLFRRNKNDRDYKELATKSNKYSSTFYLDHDGKGAPMVNYTGIYTYFNDESGNPTKTYGAIVPFIEDWVNKDKDGNPVGDPDGVKVDAGKKRCIFDALMYESSLKYKDESHTPEDPDSFYYTIDVSYPSVIDYETPDINKIDTGRDYTSDYDPARIKFDYLATKDGHKKDYIHNTTDVTAFKTRVEDLEKGLGAGESLCFLIQGVGKGRFLYEREESRILGTDDKNVVPDAKDINIDTDGIDLKSYLWVLEKDDAGNYSYLKNLRSGRYLPEIPVPANNHVDENNCMRSVEKKEDTKKFVLGVNNKDHDNNDLAEYSLTFYNPDNGRYLSVWSEGPYLSGYHTADEGCQYRLYPIKLSPTLVYKGTPRMKKKVELTTFSDATGFVEKVNEIKRNDFIQILVEVSYNAKNNDFDFKVNSWKKGGGEIAFH